MLEEEVRLGLTFDDVILIPAKSEVLPSETNTETKVSRHIAIHIPIVEFRHGHRDRITTGYRIGSRRRNRGYPSCLVSGRSGSRSRQG